MRIAQVAPLIEPVPPPAYGGTERVVSLLTEELVKEGHDVTLFASGDSRTAAKLAPIGAKALRSGGSVGDPAPDHLLQVELVMQRAREFDVLHFHIDFYHFTMSRRCKTPSLTTFHGRLDDPVIQRLCREFRDLPVVSISNAQRQPLPFMNWVGNVPHGLPQDLYALRPEARDYLAFLGRISPEKGADRAIEIAMRVGLPLKIAAKIDPVDKAYFEREIRPMLDKERVEFVGEISDAQKQDFLGNARALLFPIDWPEPFGLVMIEAFACGTPVVAFDRGDVREVMEEGVTGYVVNDVADAVSAVMQAVKLDRARCRQAFERRFGVERMARDYTAIYNRLVTGHGSS